MWWTSTPHPGTHSPRSNPHTPTMPLEHYAPQTLRPLNTEPSGWGWGILFRGMSRHWTPALQMQQRKPALSHLPRRVDLVVPGLAPVDPEQAPVLLGLTRLTRLIRGRPQ